MDEIISGEVGRVKKGKCYNLETMTGLPLLRTGIVFDYCGKYYKLVDIEWGSDNSFYFLPYRYEAEFGERLKTETDEHGRVILSLDEIEKGGFPTKKISRHPSGFFHLKNAIGSGGKREKDGLIGPAFKNTEFYIFIVACPQAIDTLVQIEKPNSTDVIVHLPISIEPFTLQFAVWDKKNKIKIPFLPSELLGNGVIAIRNDNQDFGLVIMLVNVRKTSPEVVVRFPKRTCYIAR
jgi:hypothetical protein